MHRGHFVDRTLIHTLRIKSKSLEPVLPDAEAERAVRGGISAAVAPVPKDDKGDVSKSKNPKKSEKTSNIGWILSLTKEEKLPLAVGRRANLRPGPQPQGLRGGSTRHLLHRFRGLFLRTYSLGMVAEHIAAKLRRRLYKVLLSQELASIITTANAVVDVLSNGYRSLNSAGAPHAGVLTILPLVGTGAMLFSKFSSRLAKKHQNSTEQYLYGKAVLGGAGRAGPLEKINKSILANAKRCKRARGVFMGGLSLSINCSLFSVLYFGGSLVGRRLHGSRLLRRVVMLERDEEDAFVVGGTLRPAVPATCCGWQNTLASVKGHVRFSNINPGEVVAIVGKSGAGKTTIASLMSKIIKPTSGTVTLDGIGVVNQEPSLSRLLSLRTSCYGAEVHNKDQLIAAAKEAHAHEFIMELPNQYDTFVGEKGVELSGGQKQRIAIARALYKQTNILLFDEARALLMVASAAENRTVFIIAHRLNTIKHANRIILLEEGVIAETGTFEELNQEGTKFYNLAHNQAPLL
ncbi:P-loop containing nucleoside triphosphate hydrolase [Phytophthora cactorum]|nr:P-loop containing nucleoside triphosphate hydrolase [Phytophthora cactorum]